MSEVNNDWGQIVFPNVETEGKSILLVGGGPTTLEYDRWVDIKTDYKIVPSECYLNETMRNIVADFYVVSTRIDMTSIEFKEWYEVNKNIRFIIEPNHLWKNPPGLEMLNDRDDLCSMNIYKDYKIGILARLVIGCIFMKFSDIYVVGFDGYSKNGSGQHAYRKEIDKLDSNSSYNTYQHYRNNFEDFVKDYNTIISNGDYNNIKLHNLGYGHESNILTDLGVE